ncbi:MAG TPA: nucleotidyltransferase domain-containing protein [Oscillatoriaceae cyanobacterium M33_DOE_052]|uniref:Nucleotidyltransferase domain-containing protein n=1 Tax=Planktothricoides sp. SpSt-374 TaxID=2282167 RepID=A0A7C3VN63_9CYAN|nr:nucleotidyltransferase domain-containing protein [Oscillatoriaceae cyanobacterium M33_DOE_052]
MSNQPPFQANLILPPGTQVVTRVAIPGGKNTAGTIQGAVGIIVEAPIDNTHAYRVRFPDGGEASLRRSEISIRKQWQQPETNPLEEYNLYNYIIYRCIVGSRAFGLDDNNSDTDRRGIYLPPAQMHWSIFGVPEQLESQQTEECYWEIQKFLTLALKANPNVLECLYSPLIETTSPLAEELLGIRQIFLSQLVFQTYNGYVMSQFKKLEQDIRTRGNIKYKHAMHLIRLLISGITILKQGFVPVQVENHREQLLAIKHGEMLWEDINNWRLSLHRDFDRAVTQTKLPERPDYQTANAFLIKARQQMV